MDKAMQKKKKRKPLRRAEHWGAQVMPMAGRLAVLLICVTVFGLIFSAVQGIGAIGLRVTLSFLFTAVMLLLCAYEGAVCGAKDAAASRSYTALKEKHAPLTAKDDAACYHPLKALCAVLAVFAVPLALSAVLAVNAKDYTYALQDLPAWLTDSYGSRGDVMAPLAAYSAEMHMAAMDWVRLLVRLPVMMFINFFADPQRMSGLIDRLSPLFMLSYPALFFAGYLLGPRINRRHEKENRRAKKAAVRRAEKSSLAKELTGAQGQVHYGQRKEEHKRKELV